MRLDAIGIHNSKVDRMRDGLCKRHTTCECAHENVTHKTLRYISQGQRAKFKDKREEEGSGEGTTEKFAFACAKGTRVKTIGTRTRA